MQSPSPVDEASPGSAARASGRLRLPGREQRGIGNAAGDHDQLVVVEAHADGVELLDEFCEATGLDPAEVRSLRDYGIIGDRGEDGSPYGIVCTVAGAAYVLAIGVLRVRS